jgi:hypothetical protein
MIPTTILWGGLSDEQRKVGGRRGGMTIKETTNNASTTVSVESTVVSNASEYEKWQKIIDQLQKDMEEVKKGGMLRRREVNASNSNNDSMDGEYYNIMEDEHWQNNNKEAYNDVIAKVDEKLKNLLTKEEMQDIMRKQEAVIDTWLLEVKKQMEKMIGDNYNKIEELTTDVGKGLGASKQDGTSLDKEGRDRHLGKSMMQLKEGKLNTAFSLRKAELTTPCKTLLREEPSNHFTDYTSSTFQTMPMTPMMDTRFKIPTKTPTTEGWVVHSNSEDSTRSINDCRISPNHATPAQPDAKK